MPFVFLQMISNIPLMVIWLETNTTYFHPAKVTCPSYERANEYQLKNTAEIPHGVYRACNSWVTSCECPPPPHIPGTPPAVFKSWHWHPTSLGETIQKTPTNMDKGFLSKAQRVWFPSSALCRCPWGVHGPAEVTPNGQHVRNPQDTVSEREWTISTCLICTYFTTAGKEWAKPRGTVYPPEITWAISYFFLIWRKTWCPQER